MLASNVVLGEASESDSEDEGLPSSLTVVDDKSTHQQQKNTTNKRLMDRHVSTSSDLRPKIDECPSLLHQTLRSKNGQLRSCLVHVYCHPYESAAKDIDAISQKLIGSQRIIQTVDMSLRKIKRELDQIELMSWPAMISPRWNINDD